MLSNRKQTSWHITTQNKKLLHFTWIVHSWLSIVYWFSVSLASHGLLLVSVDPGLICQHCVVVQAIRLFRKYQFLVIWVTEFCYAKSTFQVNFNYSIHQMNSILIWISCNMSHLCQEGLIFSHFYTFTLVPSDFALFINGKSRILFWKLMSTDYSQHQTCILGCLLRSG